ncbi:MAG: AraC family transcriptional regulator [Mariniphaga sp.]
MIIARYNKANIYLDRKKFSQASQQFEQLLEICRKEKMTGGIARAYSAISSLCDEAGNHLIATKYLLLAIHLADSTGETSLAIDLMKQLVSLYKENGQFKDAMLLSERFQAVRDSIQTIDKQLAVHEMEMLYHTEKKDKENIRLKTFVINQKGTSNNRRIIILILLTTIFILVILFWIGLKLYRQRGCAYNVQMIKYKAEKEVYFSTLSALPVSENPTENNIPQKTENEPLIESLFHYFRTEKPYLDPKLKVNTVAVRLNGTQKAISAALNNYNGSNFTSFINQFRVEEVKKIMDEDPSQNYKIEAIAADAGFGNRQSFYNAFEQYTGVKPGYYRKNILERKFDYHN